MRRVTALFIILLLAAPLAASAAPTPTPSPTPVPVPSSSVGTPSPEALAMPTRTPRGWYQVGGAGFDIGAMTVQERVDLISALQNANMLEQVKDSPSIEGLRTSRLEPSYIGQRVAFDQETTFGVNAERKQLGRITMTMTSVVRGEEAAALVFEMNPLNDPAPAKKEYVVATIDVGVTSEDTSDRFMFTMYDFEPISSKGRALGYAVVTDEMNQLNLFSGGSGTMRVTALVDEGLEILFCYKGNIWFSTLQL